jgi:hypothetical protein
MEREERLHCHFLSLQESLRLEGGVFLFSNSNIIGIIQRIYDVIFILNNSSSFHSLLTTAQCKTFRMDDQQSLAHLALTVATEKLPLFTTVLQSGIEIMTPGGTSIGRLLNTLPGFTAEYLANTVQTIFHNGYPVDDLTTLLAGEKPVLALSAAMPGLAGAIFRKNSFHAALRSTTKTDQVETLYAKPLMVTLKLFNTIALDRGEELLLQGVVLPAETLSSFLLRRPALVPAIVRIQLDGEDINPATLLQRLSLAIKVDLKILAPEKRDKYLHEICS